MGGMVGEQFPEGVVTLLFSDIEGSTRLLHELGDAYGGVLADHHRILRTVWAEHRGVEVGTEGDAFFVAFTAPRDAVRAAQAAQRALAGHAWPQGRELRVRMGVHTGSPKVRGRDYWGIDVHYAARLCSAAHGGQVLLSESTVALAAVALDDFEVHDLGLHALKDFPSARRLSHLTIDGRGSDSYPPPRTLRAGMTNLPDQISSFVGREREVQRALDLLDGETRVLTLVGAGGVGKTRLALESAARLLDGSRDGVWLVELAALTDPRLVEITVATTLGVQHSGDGPVLNSLVDDLRGRTLLVVIDNCEHVIDAAAGLIEGLVLRCPGVSVLATSREPLSITGEQVYRVPSLSVPVAENEPVERLLESDAVRLFLQRAAQHDARFELDDGNARSVAAVCRRLDGIPLAIELAAARLGSMAIGDIEARLDHRLRLLAGRSRSGMPRQRTLAALIDWSYDLLDQPERDLLARLSVFAGGFDLDAAETVGANQAVDRFEIADLIGALVDKSLVGVDDASGAIRYRLSEIIREYARAKLTARGANEQAAVGAAHRDHYLALADTGAQGLTGRDQVEWLDRLDADLDNFRAALSFSLTDPDPGPGLRLASSLARFGRIRGHEREILDALDRQLNRPPEGIPTRVRGEALFQAARTLASVSSGTERMVFRAREALEIGRATDDGVLVAGALGELGQARMLQGDFSAALALWDEALAVARPTGNLDITAHTLQSRGDALHNLRQDSRAPLEEALGMFRVSGDRMGAAATLNSLAEYEAAVGDLQSAKARYAESLEIMRQLGSQLGLVTLSCNLARVTYLGGDSDAARALAIEAIALAHKHRYQDKLAYGLLVLALATAATDPELAVSLHGTADGMAEELGFKFESFEADLRAAVLERLRTTLGADAFSAAYQAGRVQPIDVTIALALAAPAD